MSLRDYKKNAPIGPREKKPIKNKWAVLDAARKSLQENKPVKKTAPPPPEPKPRKPVPKKSAKMRKEREPARAEAWAIAKQRDHNEDLGFTPCIYHAVLFRKKNVPATGPDHIQKVGSYREFEADPDNMNPSCTVCNLELRESGRILTERRRAEDGWWEIAIALRGMHGVQKPRVFVRKVRGLEKTDFLPSPSNGWFAKQALVIQGKR